MLIIEGADQLGKSVLCQKLLKRLNDHIYASFTRLPTMFNYLSHYTDRASIFVVQDRFHMSEIAYAHARGDRSPLTPEKYRLVDAYLTWHAAAFTVVIFCEEEELRGRWQDREEMYNIDQVVKANAVFREISRTQAVAHNNAMYFPQFDLGINVQHDYVTDDQVEHILNAYGTHLKEFHSARFNRTES